MKNHFSKILFGIIFLFIQNTAITQTVYTYNFTGWMQSFTVPPCVTSIAVNVQGAQGGGPGGLGAVLTGNLAVTPGQVLQIRVGGQGNCPGAGYGGGGSGQNSNVANGQSCGGGGSSFIGTGGGITNALVVAAGGGGDGGGDTEGQGGNGGCAIGQAGTTTFGYGGGGGTQTAGGVGGNSWTAGGGAGQNGSFGQGGNGGPDSQYGNAPGGGGGGGWYGGGGGGSDNISSTSSIGGGGGGGGSSLVPAGFVCVAGGNTGAGQIIITVNVTTPTLTATSATICQGTSTVLTAGGGTTYTWQPGGIVGNPITVTPASTTIYTVSSGSAGCISTKTTQVVVNPKPVPTASSNSPVCLNKTLNLTGGGGGTYSWAGPNGYSSVAQNPVIAVSQTTNQGTYTLTVTSAAGCTQTITTPVVISPLPVITVNNPTACVNGVIGLTSTGGGTYAWTGPNSFSSGAQNPNIAGATTAMAGVYTVIVTSAVGCTAAATSTVTVITLPMPSITSNTPCVNGTLNLTGNGGNTYNWTGPNGFTSGAQNPNITNVPAAAGGVYNLTVTVGACSNSTTAPVTINPLPNPTAVSNSPVCLNTPINFTGGGATTYTWTGPNGYSSNVQNPVIASAQATNNGTYTLTVTNVNGCVNFTTTPVTVDPLPVITVNNPTVCVNNTINLTSTGGSTYSWSGPLGFTSGAQNPSIINATTSMSGVYTVVVTSAAGCTASATSTVSVLNLPVPTSQANTPCIGATLTFTGSGSGNYNWTGPNGFSSTVQNPTIPNVTAAAGGTYTLLLTAGTCSASSTVFVTINPLPNPTAVSNSPVCLNTPINFTGGGATTYTWTGPNGYTDINQNPTIASAQATNNGTYTLTVTDANSCVNFTTTSVTVDPLPVIVVSHPTVCVNQTINLASSGGVTYAWSGPNGFTSALQNPAMTATATGMTGGYTVIVTTAASCTASAVSNVSVITLPVPVITSNTPCVGSTLQLNGSGGSAYNWSGPNGFSSGAQNPSIPGVSLLANGMYTLVVTAGTCSDVTTASITINPLPNPTAVSNSPVCLNTPVNFTGGGASTYTWTGPNGYLDATQNAIIASAQATNNGTYTLTVTDANGCVNFTTTSVTVDPLPVITVNNPTACVNQNINFTSTGGVSYSWVGPGSYTSNVQNPTISNATTAMTGPYTVVVTSAASCTASAVSNASVIALPVPAITSNTPCVGASIQLNGTGGSSYSWVGPNGFNSGSQNPSIPNVSMAANGTYTLVVTTGMCSDFTTAVAVVNPLPTPSISGIMAVCLNQPVSLTANGGSTYAWTGPAGFTGNGQVMSMPSASMPNGGTYVVTATDANGCTNTASAQLVVNPLPVIAAVGSTVCATTNITLSSSGGNTFVWNGPNGYTSNTQFPVIANATTGMAGNYSVTVTDVNGCTSTSITNVQVNPIPTPTAAGSAQVCLNQTITLTAGAPTGISYNWTGPNAYTANGPNHIIKPAELAHTGLYAVTVTDNIGCSATAFVNVLVNPLPEGNISMTNATGCVPLCVTFTCEAATGLSSVTWDLGSGANASGTVVSKCFTNDGPVTVKSFMTDINGCVNTATSIVQVYANPTADFNFAPQKPVEGEYIDFTNSSYGQGLTNYYWYFANTTSTVITDQNPSMQYQVPGGYAVALIVVNDKGCSDTITKAVMVGEDAGIYVPNAFTPNGDGINDIFFPKGFGIVQYELNIFDRWGEILFTTKTFEEGWAGNYSGRSDKIVQNGVYIWQIKYTNVFGKANVITGTVTLEK